jgi:polysaccharide export outer membrane protein
MMTPALSAQSSESLLIGPGDLVHVLVFDTPELEQHTRVTDGGDLALVFGGTVKVAGLTPAAAAHVIESALLQSHILLKPRVQITIDEYATQKVSVLGEVHNPGAYPLSTQRSILEVLALAGGLTDMANRQILIQRYGTGLKIPYFLSNDPGVALDTAVRISPGDTVVVPKTGIVYVLGDVKAAGGYTMTNNDAKLTVLQLIARAGGTPPTAVPSHARLIHKTGNSFTDMPLPLSDMQKGKRPDIPLEADDIVYVPFSYLRNFAVNASGLVASAATAAIYRF